MQMDSLFELPQGMKTRWASAENYYYLDSPTNTLPPIEPYALRVANLTGD